MPVIRADALKVSTLQGRMHHMHRPDDPHACSSAQSVFNPSGSLSLMHGPSGVDLLAATTTQTEWLHARRSSLPTWCRSCCSVSCSRDSRHPSSAPQPSGESSSHGPGQGGGGGDQCVHMFRCMSGPEAPLCWGTGCSELARPPHRGKLPHPVPRLAHDVTQLTQRPPLGPRPSC